jgi:C1A family cysteine protease
MGVNGFTDLTHSEFLSRYVGGKRSSKTKVTPAQAGVPALDMSVAPPASVDWVTAGAVTPVKDQGQCGSCWAFATTVATEGSTFKNSSKLISLSEEQIVSCDKADGNAGCDGGDQLPALQWLMKQPGQCTEAGYPYTSGGGKTGKCVTGCTPAVKITAAIEVPPKDETALLTAIALQPISLSVDASASFWQSYQSGVVTKRCTCTSDQCLDHGVGGVGYGTDGANDFYKIKNSWSASWGENGECFICYVLHALLPLNPPTPSKTHAPLPPPFLFFLLLYAGYIRLGRGPAYGVTGQCGVQIDNQYSYSYPL